MEIPTQLPRGMWYEEKKRRFRVRRYHNKVTYLRGYHRTYEGALADLELLNEELALIPKKKRKARKPHSNTATQAPESAM